MSRKELEVDSLILKAFPIVERNKPLEEDVCFGASAFLIGSGIDFEGACTSATGLTEEILILLCSEQRQRF